MLAYLCLRCTYTLVVMKRRETSDARNHPTALASQSFKRVTPIKVMADDSEAMRIVALNKLYTSPYIQEQ